MARSIMRTMDFEQRLNNLKDTRNRRQLEAERLLTQVSQMNLDIIEQEKLLEGAKLQGLLEIKLKV